MHYAIGDVHGCYDEMIGLIEKIEAKDPDAKIYFVGDFIDRGPDVYKCIQWMMKNIKPGGKYQSVRGNHEQMVIEWYDEFCKWAKTLEENGEKIEEHLSDMPGTFYDFCDLLVENEILDQEKIREIVDMFKSLPLSIEVEITSVYGVPLTYRIVHACYDHQAVDAQVFQDKCLWERYHVNTYNNDIIVHGHTPTISGDYRGPWGNRKGMICYDLGDINVDGGCVFSHTRHMNYPCFLCAICFETLEEIYSGTLEEWAQKDEPDCILDDTDRLDKYKKMCGDFEHPSGREELLLRLKGEAPHVSGKSKWGHMSPQ